MFSPQHAEEVIAIGDSKEEQEAAQACNFKFVKISCASDLRFPEVTVARPKASSPRHVGQEEDR
jgi:hypothetical protein